MIIKEIQTKSVMTKSNLPVADFSVNPYVGCEHACKYCYASFMKRFTNHPEPWGSFIDIKNWKELKNTQKYANKEAFIGSVSKHSWDDPLKAELQAAKDSNKNLLVLTIGKPQEI